MRGLYEVFLAAQTPQEALYDSHWGKGSQMRGLREGFFAAIRSQVAFTDPYW